MPEGVFLLSASWLFSPTSGEDADCAVFTLHWPQRGPSQGGSTVFSPSHSTPLRALKNFLIAPTRTSVLSGGDAARNVGFTSIRYRNKQKWIGPWPLLASSILLLSLILTSLLSKSITHGRKRKSTSLFCIITSHSPVPGPYVKNQREKVGAGSRRQSRTCVSAGAAGPFGTLPHCSQNLLTLPP